MHIGWNSINKIILLIFSFISFSTWAQHSCGFASYLPEDMKAINQEYEKVIKKSKNLRKGNAFTIKIKPVVFYYQTKQTAITESQIRETINIINVVFEPVKIKFEIYNNNITYINSQEFTDFKLQEQEELRKKYDSEDAINLYFFKSITGINLNTLNGYSSLPNLTNGSNAIYLSYFENTQAQFELLKNKIFIHELGHYFGLLHTFQDSNHEEFSKRELVIRTNGANCAVTGDLLCDTPADPFERNTAIFSLACDSPLPDNLIDINGYRFNPPVDNYMSYQDKCGFKFTQMQFQKMEAGLNIRISPKAEYKITNDLSNSLTINSLDKNTYCSGDTINLKYQALGAFDNNSVFTIELSDKNGTNFKPIHNFTAIGNKLTFRLPEQLEAGYNYRVYLKSSLPTLESPISEHFEVKSPPLAEVTISQNKINKGDEVRININFQGSGPWGFTDWNNNKYENIQNVYLSFIDLPSDNKFYKISQIENQCGILGQDLGVFVNVFQPSIKIIEGNQSIFCNESLVELKTEGLVNNMPFDYYKVNVSGINENYTLIPSINQNTVSFVLPNEIKLGKKYKYNIFGKNLGEFSVSNEFELRNQPLQPAVVTPVNICSQQENVFLEAEGQNLKWYSTNDSKEFTLSVLLNSSIPGNYNYFVTQTDSNGCESEKSKIDVKVNGSPTATISGDSKIILGDSAQIKINFTGIAPWQFKINDTGPITSTTEDYIVNIKPTESTTFKVYDLSNACGVGFTLGEAFVEVVTVLNNFPSNFSNKINVFPNPIFKDFVKIELLDYKESIRSIQVNSFEGKTLKAEYFNLTNQVNLNIDNLPTGKYILNIRTDKQIYHSIIQVVK